MFKRAVLTIDGWKISNDPAPKGLVAYRFVRDGKSGRWEYPYVPPMPAWSKARKARK